MRTWRNRVVATVAVVVTLACLTLTGVIVDKRGGPLVLIPGFSEVILNKPDPYAQTADQLRRILAVIPVPAGASLVEEQVVEATFDRLAFVRRTYRYPAGDRSSEGVLAALSRAGLSPPGTALLSDRMGQVRVLPPGLSGEGATLSWDGERLQIDLLAGQVK